MRSGGRSSGGVSERTVAVTKLTGTGRRMMRASARMTSVNVPERMNELRDGVIRPFDATREGRRGSISEIPDNWARR